MELIGQQTIAASQQATWDALNNPEVLKQCITGCESVELTGESQYLAKMAVKIGPVNAKFTGKLQLSDVVAPHSYTIHFDGQGGVAGFGKGSAKVALSPQGDTTLLDYSANAQIGGKLAQIGSRLVDAAAKKIADEFFTRFNAYVSTQASSDLPGQLASNPVQTPTQSVLDGGGTPTQPNINPSAFAPVPSSGRQWLWPAIMLVVGIVIGWLVK
jgi:uncharacterized protein